MVLVVGVLVVLVAELLVLSAAVGEEEGTESALRSAFLSTVTAAAATPPAVFLDSSLASVLTPHLQPRCTIPVGELIRIM